VAQPLAGPDPSVAATLADLSHPAAVVNLTVSGSPPTFFVATPSDAILVHNKGGGG
jgi:hypothetical protein